MKIKVKLLSNNIYITLPKIIKKGDWIDLSLSKNISLSAPQSGTLREKKNEHGVITRIRNIELPVTLLPLGISIKLPKELEAIVIIKNNIPRKFGIVQANAIEIIDNSNYNELILPIFTLRSTDIKAGTKIAQFRIQLSPKANIWQKLKWAFSRKIKIVEYNN